MPTVPTLKDKISEIINQCKDTPAEVPYQKSCKLEYELLIHVLKICGDPLEGAKVIIHPFSIKNEEEKELTKAKFTSKI